MPALGLECRAATCVSKMLREVRRQVYRQGLVRHGAIVAMAARGADEKTQANARAASFLGRSVLCGIRSAAQRERPFQRTTRSERRLPAVVRERLVGLRHAVDVVLALVG